MSKGARQRAANLFKKPGEDTPAAVSEREAERRAAAAKTARLRASRLARDAGETAGGGATPASDVNQEAT
jgi:hypothetical protein